MRHICCNVSASQLDEIVLIKKAMQSTEREQSVRMYSHSGILNMRAAVITLYLVNSKTSLTLPGVGTGCAAF